jgi:hypothetical protein
MKCGFTILQNTVPLIKKGKNAEDRRKGKSYINHRYQHGRCTKTFLLQASSFPKIERSVGDYMLVVPTVFCTNLFLSENKEERQR